ncbi:MAG: alpha/beta hydrolase [Panacagrimonas sp.]
MDSKLESASAPPGEGRVTAGLRGASWNPRLLPPGMRTAVHPLTTSDGVQAVGCLHSLGGEKTAVFIMHPRELLISHYMVPYLVHAGFACWVQGPRTVGNDLRLEHETALYDVEAGVTLLRALGFDRIAMLGNSGGAGLFAYYNQQSLAAPVKRIARTPGGKPTKFEDAALPTVDGFVFVAPHPGQGKLLQAALDPSVTSENDPFGFDPALFAFSAENGFKPGKEGGSTYSPDFVGRYRAAQQARVARIDAFARDLISKKQWAAKAMKEGDESPLTQMNAAYGAMFTVWRTDADLRCFDLKLDPSDRRWGTVWGAKPFVSNVGSVGFARLCTPESWLSTWSGLSSNASFEKCGPAIQQPVLMIEYTGDNTVFPGDANGIYASIASPDKQRQRVRGNHHGQALKPDEPLGQDEAAAHVVEWLRAEFR